MADAAARLSARRSTDTINARVIVVQNHFNLTLSVMFNNVINHYNPGGFVGNLASPQFAQPTGINSGFGGGGGPGGGGPGGSTANNRRIEFQTRFTF